MARILVIDDEDVVRRLLRFALESTGHEVVEAREGEEALRLHQAAPAQLVITDIHMPERDGLEVIMALRREFPQVRVIAMSGGGRFKDTRYLNAAAPLGAFIILQKPFQLDTMLAAVNQALNA